MKTINNQNNKNHGIADTRNEENDMKNTTINNQNNKNNVIIATKIREYHEEISTENALIIASKMDVSLITSRIDEKVKIVIDYIRGIDINELSNRYTYGIHSICRFTSDKDFKLWHNVSKRYNNKQPLYKIAIEIGIPAAKVTEILKITGLRLSKEQEMISNYRMYAKYYFEHPEMRVIDIARELGVCDQTIYNAINAVGVIDGGVCRTDGVRGAYIENRAKFGAPTQRHTETLKAAAKEKEPIFKKFVNAANKIINLFSKH